MRHTNPPDFEHYLARLASEALPGDRLPTMRELMKRFGVSQMMVQRALQELKNRGLVESRVGRGTHFVGVVGGSKTLDETAVPAAKLPPSVAKSVLLLRRSVSIARGRYLVEGLSRRLSDEGHHVMELAYTDSGQALSVLRGVPKFDACVVQSTFKALPIALLDALRAKCVVLAVDGAALVGADVEAVGTEWGEPLAASVDLLIKQGHRSIAYATTSFPSLAIQLGRRRFQYLQHTLPGVALQEITLDVLPHENYAPRLVERIRELADGEGGLPFTALVTWGIEDGAQFQNLLAQADIAVPQRLSVVLLGRTDLVSEHADFFHVIGCSVADQIDALHKAIVARWTDPSLSYGIHLTPLTERPGTSVATPG